MGITIHFEGQLKDDDAYGRVVSSAKACADKHSWSYTVISEQETTLQRVRGGEDWDYVGPTKGIEIQPHENSEPLRLEFDKDLYIQEYVKTQFAPQEIHIKISEFLHSIESEFVSIEVIDEGEYFESVNITTLEKHRAKFFETLDEYLAKEDKYYGPVRLKSGRIIDVMERE